VSMKAYVLDTAKGIDGLAIRDVPTPPTLGPGQVRVAVRAVSVNYRDLLVVSGAMGARSEMIPCSDAAGEVVEAAPDVSRFTAGERVVLTFNPDWIAGGWRPSPRAGGRGSPAVPGVMCDEMVVHQSELVSLPAGLSFTDGATLPCAAVTAWHALAGASPLLPGMTVLLQGGGGVSLFALQFAKLFGARVIMISSNPDRCARLRQLGADHTIDYVATPEWQKAVRDATGGQGVDLAIDVGGAATVDRAFASTRMGGRIALVGLLTGQPRVTASLFAASLDITPIRVGSREDLENIVRAMSVHGTRPVIDSLYTFGQLPDALRHLQAGRHLGKIAIKFD
jgi:NADPH:quinone reductase-like Zn-dependent oxidoreductase